MRALAERVPGYYRPSPGAVYPVLRQLAEEGMVVVTPHDGKRVFAITPDGRRFLREQGPALIEIRSRLDSGGDPELRGTTRAFLREMNALSRALEPALQRRLAVEDLRRAHDILSRARHEIEALPATEPARAGRARPAASARSRTA